MPIEHQEIDYRKFGEIMVANLVVYFGALVFQIERLIPRAYCILWAICGTRAE